MCKGLHDAASNKCEKFKADRFKYKCTDSRLLMHYPIYAVDVAK